MLHFAFVRFFQTTVDVWTLTWNENRFRHVAIYGDRGCACVNGYFHLFSTHTHTSEQNSQCIWHFPPYSMSHHCTLALALCALTRFINIAHCPMNLNGIIYAVSSNRYQLPSVCLRPMSCSKPVNQRYLPSFLLLFRMPLPFIADLQIITHDLCACLWT